MNAQKTDAYWGAHATGVRHAIGMRCPSCEAFYKSDTVSWYNSVVGYRPDTVSMNAIVREAISLCDQASVEKIIIHECPRCFKRFWLHIDPTRPDFQKYQNTTSWPTKSS